MQLREKIKQFLTRRERFAEGAAVLTITTFFSYLTGLLRDRLFARTFGAGTELDLYNASFIIPDLLLNILVASGISAAFIPVFTSLLAQNEKEKANRLANTMLHSACAIVIIAGTLAAIFMPWLVDLIAPGFSATQKETLMNLARFMLISPLIMAVSNTFGAMLVSFKNFLPYGLSPILYNIGIIGGIYLFPWLSVYGLVAGTLIGALFHLTPRIFAMRAKTFKYEFRVKLRDANFIKVIKLMIPKMIGHPVEQLTFLAATRLATTLIAGSVTAISFARNFQSVPVSLFGIAFSVAIFPTLSECAAKNDRGNFIRNFRKALRDILIFTVPSAVGLYFLSDLPIKIFLAGGKFSDENVLRVASALSVFALSIPTESLIHLLARSFYALKNTYIPVLFSLLNFLIFFAFASYELKNLGILAIPYGFFLGSLSEVLMLGFILRLKLKALRQS